MCQCEASCYDHKAKARPILYCIRDGASLLALYWAAGKARDQGQSHVINSMRILDSYTARKILKISVLLQKFSVVEQIFNYKMSSPWRRSRLGEAEVRKQSKRAMEKIYDNNRYLRGSQHQFGTSGNGCL